MNIISSFFNLDQLEYSVLQHLYNMVAYYYRINPTK